MCPINVYIHVNISVIELSSELCMIFILRGLGTQNRQIFDFSMLKMKQHV